MQVIESLSEWRALRPTLTGAMGLVPTMGAFHEGHLSLIRRAREENELVTVWIFVNSKQFDDPGDFSAYPRDLGRDLRLLEEIPVDLVLAPGPDEVYPPGFQSYVTVEELTKRLEGESRPGHFRGMTTVVAKMLCLAQSRRAYFGQKDAQQSIVVRRLVADLAIPTEIVVCPTVREPDGLAMSSRNVHLNPGQRQAATILHRTLQEVSSAVKGGERRGEVLRKIMGDFLRREPAARVEYVSVADPETLEECEVLNGPALASLAVSFGRTRLIDNMPLELP